MSWVSRENGFCVGVLGFVLVLMSVSWFSGENYIAAPRSVLQDLAADQCHCLAFRVVFVALSCCMEVSQYSKLLLSLKGGVAQLHIQNQQERTLVQAGALAPCREVQSLLYCQLGNVLIVLRARKVDVKYVRMLA